MNEQGQQGQLLREMDSMSSRMLRHINAMALALDMTAKANAVVAALAADGLKNMDDADDLLNRMKAFKDYIDSKRAELEAAE